RRHPAEGVGRQPHLGRCAGAIRADVSVADLLAARAFGNGLLESTLAGHAGGAGLAPVTHRSQAYAARQALSLSPSRSYHALIATPGSWLLILPSLPVQFNLSKTAQSCRLLALGPRGIPWRYGNLGVWRVGRPAPRPSTCRPWGRGSVGRGSAGR